MRILILNQWFEPEPALKGLYFAKELQRQGHEVQVITGYPNYPGGKIYPGHRIRGVQRMLMENVPVIRVPLFPSHSRSIIGRIVNYVTFAASATFVGLFTRFKPDVIYVYHPPLTVDLAACIIGGIRRVPIVVDVLDLWPDTLKATGLIGNPLVLSIIGELTQWVYARAARIVVLSPGLRNKLIERGVPEEKIRLIHCWCGEESLAACANKPQVLIESFRGKFTVVYAGNMGPAQALHHVLDAADIVGKQQPAIQFIFIGGGLDAATLEEKARARQLANVTFLPQVPMAEIGSILDAAGALLVHLRVDPLFTVTIPSKTQAYLFTGKPIIMAVEGDAAELVASAKAGIAATPEDAASIAAVIMTIASMTPPEREAMGRRGRQYYDENLSLKAGTAKMVATFESAIELYKRKVC